MKPFGEIYVRFDIVIQKKLSEDQKEVEVFMFVPDLTGYTEFMAANDSKESHVLIERVLKAMVNANELDFELSDIYGDAIFFFKIGSMPSVEDLQKQCKNMLIALQKELVEIGHFYQWNQKLLMDASVLTIKFIAHFGEARVSDIGGRRKLIGKSVIETHSLLKNNVNQRNYLLASENYLSQTGSFFGTVDSEEYKHLGEIKYCLLPI